MPTDQSTPIAPDPYTVACDRAVNQIIKLAEARGVEVSVDVDPCVGAYGEVPTSHQIEITYEHYTRTLAVDHDIFMDEVFFKTDVLPQVAAAIEELIRRDGPASRKQMSGTPSTRG